MYKVEGNFILVKAKRHSLPGVKKDTEREVMVAELLYQEVLRSVRISLYMDRKRRVR